MPNRLTKARLRVISDYLYDMIDDMEQTLEMNQDLNHTNLCDNIRHWTNELKEITKDEPKP